MAGIAHNEKLYSPPRDVPMYEQRLAFEDEANAILHRRRFWEGMMATAAGKGRPPISRSVRMMSVANAQEVRHSERWQGSRHSRQACYSYSGVDGRFFKAYGDIGRAVRRAEKAAQRAGRVLAMDMDTFTPARREPNGRRSRKSSAVETSAQVHRLAHIVGTIHPTS